MSNDKAFQIITCGDNHKKNAFIFVLFKIESMHALEQIIAEKVILAVKALYGKDCAADQIQIQKTRKEFDGDVTLVVFPLLKLSGKSPDATAQEIGDYLTKNCNEIQGFNVIKGFLNLIIIDSYYLEHLNMAHSDRNYGFATAGAGASTIMVEYSSPNTNKPLHLGHIRNNLLGYAVSRIIEASGNKVIKTNLVNDRGIHICKSMLAWQKWGRGETPEISGKKGDHLVGDYYVKFDQEYKKQIQELVASGMKPEEAAKKAELMLEAQEMLRKWESGDKEVRDLWAMMNAWVFKGFDETYERLGVEFNKVYYESETWIHGKNMVLDGLSKNILVKHPDGSVWADLRDKGLDEKVLLRSDGTSVYMTQDIGTAQVRQKEYRPDRMVYVVGNEQNYHFKVLAIVLDMLGFPWAKTLHHLSYGMVELPEGKMKSREGTVVDADDLMDEMIETAREMSKELGKLDGLDDAEKEDIFRIIGMGALKYYMLKVDPVKNMLFNPRESIDFDGNTGPFIQYTYTRIRSIFRKSIEMGFRIPSEVRCDITLNTKEKSLLKLIYEYPAIIHTSADNFNPSLIANFIYDMVKEYNQFYHDYSILKEEDGDIRNFRLLMSETVSGIVKRGMELLGIDMPERM